MNVYVFAFKLYAIVCVPLKTPTFFYLRHHRATSNWLDIRFPMRQCLEEFRHTLIVVGDCTNTCSCGCNVWLRELLTIRSMASHRVFHLNFNLSQFTLTSRTLYHQYIYAVEQNIFPIDRLISLTFSKLQCTFVRDKRCEISKRFHNDCVIPCERYWSTLYAEDCATKEQAIVTSFDEKFNWWRKFYNRPLFKTTSCLFF